MRRLLTFFDYIFYRTYMSFHKRRDDIAWFRGAVLVGILQGLIAGQLFYILRSFYHFPLLPGRKGLTGGLLALVFIALSWVRYGRLQRRDQFATFHARWGSIDGRTIRRHGWLIVLFIFVVVFVLTAFAAWVHRVGTAGM
jgi:hypothetical protein